MNSVLKKAQHLTSLTEGTRARCERRDRTTRPSSPGCSPLWPQPSLSPHRRFSDSPIRPFAPTPPPSLKCAKFPNEPTASVPTPPSFPSAPRHTAPYGATPRHISNSFPQNKAKCHPVPPAKTCPNLPEPATNPRMQIKPTAPRRPRRFADSAFLPFSPSPILPFNSSPTRAGRSQSRSTARSPNTHTPADCTARPATLP
jgi:hypothetical protein